MSEVISWLDENNWQAGWRYDPEINEAYASTLSEPTFSSTEADLFPVSDLPKEVFMWKPALTVLKLPYLKVENQGNLGSCTGFGTCRAIEYTMLAEIGLANEPEEFKYLCRGVQYAGSRVEANGGRSPFRGDGSTGSLNAKFATQWGIIDQGIYAGYDLGQYDIPVIREWASKGVPDVLEPYIKQHTISNATLVRNALEAQKALAQGYGISVCSNQGFTTTRDVDGVCAPKSNWAHCMCISGYVYIKGDLFFMVENSWGNYLGTKNLPAGNPNIGTFAANAKVVNSMLALGDSYAFSGVNGFKKRKLSWDL